MPLKSRIPQLVRALEKACDDIADELADIVIEAEVEKVAVDEGDLIKTIRKATETAQNGEQAVLAGDPDAHKEDGRPVDYVGHVEYGTYKMDPRPFATPAAERGRRERIPVAKDVLRKAIG